MATDISRRQALGKEKSTLKWGNSATKTCWRFTWVKNGVHKHIKIYSELTYLLAQNLFVLQFPGDLFYRNTIAYSPCSPATALNVGMYPQFATGEDRTEEPVSLTQCLCTYSTVFFNGINTCSSKAVRKVSWPAEMFVTFVLFSVVEYLFCRVLLFVIEMDF